MIITDTINMNEHTITPARHPLVYQYINNALNGVNVNARLNLSFLGLSRYSRDQDVILLPDM